MNLNRIYSFFNRTLLLLLLSSNLPQRSSSNIPFLFYSATLFRPNRIILTVFSNDLSANGKETQMRIWNNELPGYVRTNLQFLRLQVAMLSCSSFWQIFRFFRANVFK